jgi:hypothetical protein
MSRKRALSPPSTSEIELFGSCVLNHGWVFLGLLPSQLVQPAHGGSWVVNRVHLVREQRGETLVSCVARVVHAISCSFVEFFLWIFFESLQGEVGIIFESPDQKTRGFVVQIALPW